MFISDVEGVNKALLMRPLFPNSIVSAKIPEQNDALGRGALINRGHTLPPGG